MLLDDLHRDPLDRLRFPLDQWRLVERIPLAAVPRPDPGDLGRTETLFAVANGYLGIRGTPEEGRDTYAPGTFVNGFHETWPIRHAEDAYGFARVGQTMIGVPDATLIRLYVDDEPLRVSTADLLSYERALDFRRGMLTRELVWRTPAGKRVVVRTTRMVPFAERHLALLTLEVTVLDNDASVIVSSQVLHRRDPSAPASDIPDPSRTPGPDGDDPRRSRRFGRRPLDPDLHRADGDRLLLGYHCHHSGMTLAVGAEHAISTANLHLDAHDITPDRARAVFHVRARRGEPTLITKAVSYHTADGVPAEELADRVGRTLDRVRVRGRAAYARDQRAWLDDWWARTDVTIGGRPAVQQAVRWCLYQVAQAAGSADGAGIPAKGLTGTGYEGHYFWDSEAYVVPLLALTNPELARNALLFRVRTLPQARRRAEELTVAGALFPWRTIGGDEASANYASGTAQYHIDADIAQAIRTYATVTHDREFLHHNAAPVLVETARMWADLGFWREVPAGPGRDGSARFEIHGVTGPDEYTTVVNNNFYTNVMARANLRYAASVVKEMAAIAPDAYDLLVRATGLRAGEIGEWERCADGMYIPYDAKLGIHPQDDQFLPREVWDLSHTPADHFPLLLHYHPLVIYRHQVLKQADVVFALYLRAEEFSAEEVLADFEYYDPITTGDSTLSAVVQAIVAAQVGHRSMAMNYFLTGLYVDIADLHTNTGDGTHIASAAGTWSALVAGFGGLRMVDGTPTFDPRLPEEWESLGFRITLHGQRLEVLVRPASMTLTLREGDGLDVVVRGETYAVGPGAPVEVALDGQGPDLRDLVGHLPRIRKSVEGGASPVNRLGPRRLRDLVPTVSVPTTSTTG